jgi:hypothetical protein
VRHEELAVPAPSPGELEWCDANVEEVFHVEIEPGTNRPLR